MMHLWAAPRACGYMYMYTLYKNIYGTGPQQRTKRVLFYWTGTYERTAYHICRYKYKYKYLNK